MIKLLQPTLFIYATLLKQHIYKNLYAYICFCNFLKGSLDAHFPQVNMIL